MVFSSLTFLYLFLPACLLVYFQITDLRAKNGILIVFSLLFYAWGEPIYVLLMLGLSLLNWAIGRMMGRWAGKPLLVVAVTLDLAAIGLFKYAGFVVESLNAVTGLKLAVPQIALPIGISFFTFQILSYVVDVYRKKVEIQKSFWRFLLYVSLFPQLIAGPIVRYCQVEKEIGQRKADPEEIFYGLTRFAMGLGKKVLIADYAGKAASQLLDGNLLSQSTAAVWLGVLLYMFQIYFDFSGYSDMAIGMGRMFGFHYPENFTLPYVAKSITDFWRRWHISLSGFFRDYVYIPLGGNRKHVYLNLLIVWALTGLWHGASWNFVLWGLYFFVILSLERLLKKPLERVPGPLRHLLTLLLIFFGWNIFYFTDPVRLWDSFRVLFGAAGTGLGSEQAKIALINNLPLLLLCTVGSTPIPRIFAAAVSILCAGKTKGGAKQVAFVLVTFVFDLSLLALSTVALVSNSFNAFLYLRF